LKEQYKIRLKSFEPQLGLNDDEAFFIRSAPSHARGGTDKIFAILITDKFEFYCFLTEIKFGVNRSFKFYFTGNLPAHLIPFLKTMVDDPLFQQMSEDNEVYSTFDNYQGNFDISYKREGNSKTAYIDYNGIDNVLKKLKKTNTSSIKKRMFDFQDQFEEWLYTLSGPYLEMMQKGIFSIEIEYD